MNGTEINTNIRNTLEYCAVKGPGPDFVCYGIYRKVVVGKFLSNASRIVWEYKTADGWGEAATEQEAIALAAPGRSTR